MLIFVLPAYNEAGGIADLLTLIDETMRASGQRHRTILVDDGSTDGTRHVASRFLSRMPLTLLGHSRNRGLGVALWTGLFRASRIARPTDVVVTMDADGSHDPALAPRMAEQILRGASDVVIASRFAKGGLEIGVPLHRRLLSRCAGLAFRALFPVDGVRDYTSGYRAYSASSLHRAFEAFGRSLLTETGFCCMVELLHRMHTMGLRFSEVPLQLRYDNKVGRSKMLLARTVRSYIRFPLTVLALRTPPPLEPVEELQSHDRIHGDLPSEETHG